MNEQELREEIAKEIEKEAIEFQGLDAIASKTFELCAAIARGE